jgi:hypothetical protein
LTLEDEIDISRGDLLTLREERAPVARRFNASLVWMDAQPLDPARRYLLKHTSQTVPVQSVRVRHQIDVATLAQHPAQTLEMNGIGLVEVETRRPIALDAYSTNRTTGAFVLIDAVTNTTAGAGMIREIVEHETRSASGPVTADERTARWGHTGAVIRLAAPAALIDSVERELIERGAVVVRTNTGNDALNEALNEALAAAGVIALAATQSDLAQPSLEIDDEKRELAPDANAQAILHHLQQAGVLQQDHV